MNAVLTTPDASPASSGATSLIAASSTGFIAIPTPTPRMTIAGEHVDDEAAVDRRPGEQHEAERDERHADRDRRTDPEAHHEARRQAERERAHDQRGGQEGEPDLERL